MPHRMYDTGFRPVAQRLEWSLGVIQVLFTLLQAATVFENMAGLLRKRALYRAVLSELFM